MTTRHPEPFDRHDAAVHRTAMRILRAQQANERAARDGGATPRATVPVSPVSPEQYESKDEERAAPTIVDRAVSAWREPFNVWAETFAPRSLPIGGVRIA